MDTDRADFIAWLHAAATAAGYDPSVRGSNAALATAAAVDPSAVSRFMSGDKIPQISTQRAIALVLNIEPLEMYVRSGTIAAEDVPDEKQPKPAPTGAAALQALANEWGVPTEKREMLFGVLEAVTRHFAQPGSDAEGD